MGFPCFVNTFQHFPCDFILSGQTWNINHKFIYSVNNTLNTLCVLTLCLIMSSADNF